MTRDELSKLSANEKAALVSAVSETSGYWLIPDYTRSLDAMHRAIMKQPPEFRKAMRFALWELTDQMSAHFADAATMCDAFLLTLK